VIPYDPGEKEIPLKETVIFMGDITSPVAEEDWEVLRRWICYRILMFGYGCPYQKSNDRRFNSRFIGSEFNVPG
jgi:hypothetical protein